MLLLLINAHTLYFLSIHSSSEAFSTAEYLLVVTNCLFEGFIHSYLFLIILLITNPNIESARTYTL